MPREKEMAVGTLCYRKEVLSLYRRIFRIARQWHAITTGDAAEESRYIREEARKLFRRYKHITKPVEIELRIFEATARIEIALDFGTPYLDVLTSEFSKMPRMSNRSHLMMSLMQSKEYHHERLKKLAQLGLASEWESMCKKAFWITTSTINQFIWYWYFVLECWHFYLKYQRFQEINIKQQR